MSILSRRAFLQAAMLTTIAQSIPVRAARLTPNPPLQITSASKQADGHYYAQYYGEASASAQFVLPARAHHVINHPTQPWLIVIARRPDTFIEIIDYQTGKQVTQRHCEPGYHLCGHGQIAKAGRWLLTTEESDASENGFVIIRDIEDDFNVIARWSTHGIGPHELRVHEPTNQLVVANGGILTQGRDKLNLETMQPSLVYLDLETGQLLEQVCFEPALHQCGIRHIDVNEAGDVLIGMQYEGDPIDIVPLVARHRRQQPFETLAIPLSIYGQLQHYIGSACLDHSGDFAAVSAPKGNCILVWHLPSQHYLGAVNVSDGCGVAPTFTGGEFLVSGGNGGLFTLNAMTLSLSRIAPNLGKVQWDNHLHTF